MEGNVEHFNANGINLHYVKKGSGPPLLFIPGSISDYRTWTKIQEQLADQYTCYSISRRFQYPGKYIEGGDSHVEINTDDMATFIEEKKLSPAIVIGHSFGGFIAIHLAIKYPHLIKSIIAEEPIFAPAIVKDSKNRMQVMGFMLKNLKAGRSFARLGLKGTNPAFKALTNNDLVTAQHRLIDGLTDGKKTPDTLDELTHQQLVDNITSFAGEDPFINQIQMSDLQKIRCKVLLLNGTTSPYIFQYINQELKNGISDSQHKSFNQAGHWVHIEQPDLFVARVVDFLKE